MIRSLVVGANGFLGAHLVDTLATLGHDVTAFDRYSREPISDSASRVVRGDFNNSEDLKRAVQGQDLVFHFLSVTTPASAAKDPSVDARINVAQSVELFDAAAKAGVKHLFFASSGGAVYGAQAASLNGEQLRPLPLSPYGIGKFSLELYLGSYRSTMGLQSTSLRITNPYGPGQPTDGGQGLIGTVLSRGLAGERVTMLGDGGMVRDYIFIRDLMEMTAQIVTDVRERPAVINLGSGIGHSVRDVIETAERVLGRPIMTNSAPAPASFVQSAVADIGLYVDRYGAPDFTTLEDGMEVALQAR